jgi:hypothetical protein
MDAASIPNPGLPEYLSKRIRGHRIGSWPSFSAIEKEDGTEFEVDKNKLYRLQKWRLCVKALQLSHQQQST